MKTQRINSLKEFIAVWIFNLFEMMCTLYPNEDGTSGLYPDEIGVLWLVT